MEDVIIDNQPVSVVVSKSGAIKLKMSGFGHYLFDIVIKGLIAGLLLSIDFCLFAKAGNLRIFSGGLLPSPEVLNIILMFWGVSVLVMFVCSFSEWLQNAVMALLAAFLAAAFINQFALFDKYTFLSDMALSYFGDGAAAVANGASNIITAVIVGILVLMYLGYASRSNLAYLAGILILVNAVILFNGYMDGRFNNSIVYEYDDGFAGTGKGKKYVNIMLAGAGAYNYLDEMKDRNAKENDKIDNLKKVMLGFYANNGFTFYPNAYTRYNDTAKNQIDALNPASKNAEEHVLKAVLTDGNWQFRKIKDKEVFLKNNQLAAMFNKAGYKTSAYQSRGLDMCRAANEKIVSRCADKMNFPADVRVLAQSTSEQSDILFYQWLESTGWFDNPKLSYKILNMVVHADKAPVIGQSYKKLYVINSADGLDAAAKDIAADKGNGAYFIYLDMPADMFVYNEFCMVKPASKWLAMKEQPWVKDDGSKDQAKREAYAEQYTCLFGKLQNFMDLLKKNANDENTVVVIQGLGGPNDRADNEKDRAELRLGASRQTAMAIRDPLQKEFKANKDICWSGDIVKSYLFKKGKCPEFNYLGFDEETKNNLAEALKDKNIGDLELEEAVKYYKHWYVYWQKENGLIKKEAETENKTVVPEKLLKAGETVKKTLAEIKDNVILSKNKITEKEIEVKDEVKTKSLKEEMLKNPVIEESDPAEIAEQEKAENELNEEQSGLKDE